jgi:hypothetical protein
MLCIGNNSFKKELKMETSSDHPIGFQYKPTHQSSLNAFGKRILRALQLDISLYEEVEEDKSATVQSIFVIFLSSIAAGVGIPDVSISAIAINTASALAGWFLWAYLTFLIGTKLMPEPQTEATYGQLIRTTGFASSPGLIRVFGFIPFIGPVFFLGAQIWMLLAMIIAVKRALDYESNVRAVLVSLFGWIIQIAFLMLIFYLVMQSTGNLQ